MSDSHEDARRNAADQPAAVAQPGLHRLPAAWAVVPVISLGILSWAPFLYASVRTHARKFKVATAIYLVLAVVAGTLVAVAGGRHGALNDGAGLLLILLAGAGCVHTLSIRIDYGRQLALADDPRLVAAQQRAELRERALQLAREDRGRALALGVGRPDVPGAFDGGVVDVNHAGVQALATLPGIDDERAAKIVELRSGGGGYRSLADLDLDLDLDPAVLSELGDRVVFISRS